MVYFKCRTDAGGPNSISWGLESSGREDVRVPVALAEEAEALKHELPALLLVECFQPQVECHEGFAPGGLTHTDTIPPALHFGPNAETLSANPEQSEPAGERWV